MAEPQLTIRFHPHAQERMKERGATEEDVKATIDGGEQFPVKFGRTCFRRNFTYNSVWQDRHFATKQVEVYAIAENEVWVVITVITRYF
ncbi:MAG: DUF4258 domain-containing protein [Candidatus Neomarinimicrobiota bacterium]